MKKLKQIVKTPDRYLTQGSFGVEIEVEGENLPDSLLKYWRVESDSSLKTEEAWEYVLSRPSDLNGIREALDHLEQAYQNCKSTVFDSVRAGVHVHLNVQEWSVKQLFTFACAYYLLEDILIDWCGDSRVGNLFALRSKDAEFVLFRLLNAIEERNFRYLNDENLRYASLNFCSLFKYGSIEFRAMRGTRDLDAIYTWVEIINDLVRGSETFNNPSQLVGDLSAEGERTILHRLLPTKHELFKDANLYTIFESARRIQMIAYSTDWDDLSKENLNIFSQEGSW